MWKGIFKLCSSSNYELVTLLNYAKKNENIFFLLADFNTIASREHFVIAEGETFRSSWRKQWNETHIQFGITYCLLARVAMVNSIQINSLRLRILLFSERAFAQANKCVILLHLVWTSWCFTLEWSRSKYIHRFRMRRNESWKSTPIADTMRGTQRLNHVSDDLI